MPLHTLNRHKDHFYTDGMLYSVWLKNGLPIGRVPKGMHNIYYMLTFDSMAFAAGPEPALIENYRVFGRGWSECSFQAGI